MKQQIRLSVFETNSSSVHTITMVDKSDYEKWKKGELLFCEYGNDGDGNFLPVDRGIEENIKSLLENYDEEDVTEEFIKKYRGIKNLYEALDKTDNGIDYDDLDLGEMYLTYNEYNELVSERYCYESFEEEYKTKSGDEVVAFGYFGHD